MNEHEAEFVRGFIEKDKQERVAMMLASAKRRKEFCKSLAHFRGLDDRYAKKIPARLAHTAEEWQRLLNSKGAPDRCWVVSEDSARDAKEDVLADALTKTLGRGMGSILSCIPGKLAYFEDEDGRLLLER